MANDLDPIPVMRSQRMMDVLLQPLGRDQWWPETDAQRLGHERLASFYNNEELSVEERVYLVWAHVSQVHEAEQVPSYHERWDAALLFKAAGCYREALTVYEDLAEMEGVEGRLDKFIYETAIGLGRFRRAEEIGLSWAEKNGSYRAAASSAFLAGELNRAVELLARSQYEPVGSWDGKRVRLTSEGRDTKSEVEVALCVLAASEPGTTAQLALSVLARMAAPPEFLAAACDEALIEREAFAARVSKLCTPRHIQRSGPARPLGEVLAQGDTPRAHALVVVVAGFDERVERGRGLLEAFLDGGSEESLLGYAGLVLAGGVDSLSRALVNASSGTPEHGSSSAPPDVLSSRPDLSGDRLLRLYDAVPLLREDPKRTRVWAILAAQGYIDADCIVRMASRHHIVEHELRAVGKLRAARRDLIALGSPGGGRKSVDARIIEKSRDWVYPELQSWLEGPGKVLAGDFVDAWRKRTLTTLYRAFGVSLWPPGCPSQTMQFFALVEAALAWLNAEWSLSMEDVRWKSQELCGRLIEERWSPQPVVREYAADWLGGMRYDFYLPREKLAIEYNGVQHYEAVDLFGGATGLRETQRRDRRKRLLSTCAGVRLFTVRHDEDMSAAIEAIFERMECR